MALYSLYLPGDRLTLAELSAARIDGDVFDLGDAYLAADAVETAALRAASMAPLLGSVLAATHLSAAWVWGAVPDPPPRPSVQRAVARRIHRLPDSRVHYRDGALPAEDVEDVGGVLVTTPARTLADLARYAEPAHAHAGARLARISPDARATAIRWLEGRHPLPHKRRALALLRRWQDQPEVTR